MLPLRAYVFEKLAPAKLLDFHSCGAMFDLSLRSANSVWNAARFPSGNLRRGTFPSSLPGFEIDGTNGRTLNLCFMRLTRQ